MRPSFDKCSIMKMNRGANLFRRRPLLFVSLLLILFGALTAACGSSAPTDRVHVLPRKGGVNPVMERYSKRGIGTAEDSQARAVLLRLDTPGGLDSSMRAIIQRMQSSKV